MRSFLLHVSAETLRVDRGPAYYAMGMAAALDAQLRAPVFELDMSPPAGLGLQLAAGSAALLENQNLLARAKAAELRDAAQALGAAVRVETERAMSFGVPDWLCDLAKLHDLTICGVDERGLLSERQLVEALLFRSGRPALIVPSDHQRGFNCERVMIAWDFSAPAARAVAEALPLLRQASDVVLLTVADDKECSTNLHSKDVLASLRLRGVEARTREGRREGTSIGDALQDIALKERADLLVMGAFGHSRLAEFILGGATRNVLEQPKLPVLLSH